MCEREREREVLPCVRGRGREGQRERERLEDTDTANNPKRHRMRELTLHSQSNKRSCCVQRHSGKEHQGIPSSKGVGQVCSIIQEKASNKQICVQKGAPQTVKFCFRSKNCPAQSPVTLAKLSVSVSVSLAARPLSSPAILCRKVNLSSIWK